MKFGRNAQSPIDDQVAEADIADRLRMANALRNKSNAGAQLENVGGQLVGSPVARALTGVVQGFEGGQERKKAYGMAEDLATSKRDRLAKALAGVGQEQTPEARLKRGTELMGNPDPQAQEVGRYMAESAQKDIARREEAQQKQYAETNKDLRNMQGMYQRDQAAKQQREATLEAARIRADAMKARGGAGGGPDPYFTTQNAALPDGTPIMVVTNARDGTTKAMTLDGQPISPAAYTPKLAGDLARERGREGVLGKEEGAAAANLADREASLPRLEEMATKLEGLAEKATYTWAGQTRDAIARQFGAEVPDAGVARAEYEATVSNEMLPLLRQTFGAQFTSEEGQRMTRTLGDINASPPEKNAAIRAFLDAQRGAVETGRRRVGPQAPPPAADAAGAPFAPPAADPLGLF